MQRYDVFAVGGGTTAPSIVMRLARDGLRVAMAERDRLGGECTNYGCVPSKALLKAARIAAQARRGPDYGIEIPEVRVDFPAVMARVKGIIRRMLSAGTRPFDEAGVDVLFQDVRVVGDRRIELEDGTGVEADRIVFTTGSRQTVPPIEGLTEGYWTNKEAVDLEALPSSLAILGAGPVGVEFAQIFARFGVRVSLIEALDRVLPAEDADSSGALLPALEADGIEVLTRASATKVERPGGRWRLLFDDREPVEADQLLVATGRAPEFRGHDLGAAGVELDERGHPVLTETLRTTNPSIWVAGDAVGKLLFVHVNAHEANTVVRDIRGRPRPVDYRVAPRVTFTDPEVASVGLTEEEAQERGHEVVTGIASFEHDERAEIEGERRGHVKVVADARTGEVLGGHIVGEHAGELIHEIVAVMAGRLSPPTVGGAIHAYPTRSQSVRSALSAIRT